MLMLDTDMRRAEALGMTWSDVSVENRSILIEQQFAADRSVHSPKSKKSVRRISISETLTSYLEFWKKEQAREMEAFGLEQVKGTPLVHSFERTNERQASPSQLHGPEWVFALVQKLQRRERVRQVRRRSNIPLCEGNCRRGNDFEAL